jgi:23S rRNA (guanosine2251-2'-O)-methyltransferase
VKTEILYGIHAVSEALAAARRKMIEIYVEPGRLAARVEALLAAAAAHGVSAKRLPAGQLTSLAGNAAHQGVAARVSAFAFQELADVCTTAPGQAPGLLLALDSLQDPHNLGAVLRTALCAGVEAVLVPKDRSAPPTPTVSRISAGALEHIGLVCVTNLVRSLEQLKARGLWVIGLDRDAPQGIFTADLTLPLVLVIGGESSGLRPLVKRTCDRLVSIPQQGPLDSLNASVAAAVALYEIRRQRTFAGRPG